MRAIHNSPRTFNCRKGDVVMMSKIGKMRAIHNSMKCKKQEEKDVVMMSKIGKMRAIHNSAGQIRAFAEML